ncbi:hypothetical protein UFOVP201_42 [uncultured Caudovirales phage]|uniref:Uncharacterized protein n=1 Tax=uncultured Caudovirales phage TaxID=2100421 RepID=A0A6J7WJX0_9CAUD|nr:hypothetical protein UFOVP201_42 [uncultured Caudovirales phage]
MENTINTPAPAEQPVRCHVVTQIGSGNRLHLSIKNPNLGRLYPACGSDSPRSRAREITYRTFADIDCTTCRKRAIALGLITA